MLLFNNLKTIFELLWQSTSDFQMKSASDIQMNTYKTPYKCCQCKKKCIDIVSISIVIFIILTPFILVAVISMVTTTTTITTATNTVISRFSQASQQSKVLIGKYFYQPQLKSIYLLFRFYKYYCDYWIWQFRRPE